MIAWKEVTVPTGSRVQLLDVTRHAAEQLSVSKVRNGMCYLYVPHTTAGVTINENADPDVVTDILDGLEKLVPLAATTATPRATRTPTSRPR